MLKRLSVLACACAALAGCSPASETGAAVRSPAPDVWPPRVDQPYPDLKLLDRFGEEVSLSSFKGKVILLEPVGMNCPACIAFSGGNLPDIGKFEGHAPQDGILSTPEMLSETAGVDFAHPDLVHVQLLLYNLQMKGPTVDDAKRWSDHFGVARHSNWIVLAGGDGLVGKASYDMIPGYQLIDKDFVLRVDCSGHNPGPSCRDFVPKLQGMLGLTGSGS